MIVVRYEDISMRSRTSSMRLSPYKPGHCENERLAKRDAETGITIIDNVIMRYILKEGSRQKHWLV